MNGFMEVDVVTKTGVGSGSVKERTIVKEDTERRTICVQGIRVRHSGSWDDCAMLLIPNGSEFIHIHETYDSFVDRLGAVAHVKRLT